MIKAKQLKIQLKTLNVDFGGCYFFGGGGSERHYFRKNIKEKLNLRMSNESDQTSILLKITKYEAIIWHVK